jgi:hypothetical protein
MQAMFDLSNHAPRHETQYREMNAQTLALGPGDLTAPLRYVVRL